MPGIADVVAVVRLFYDRHDVRIAFHMGVHRVHDHFAELAGEGAMLLGREGLLAKENDVVVQQRLAYGLDGSADSACERSTPKSSAPQEPVRGLTSRAVCVFMSLWSPRSNLRGASKD